MVPLLKLLEGQKLQSIQLEIFSKIMRSVVKLKPILIKDGIIERGMFYDGKTGRQVAILTRCSKGKAKLSIPIEGMGGWHVDCKSEIEAWDIAQRECHPVSKLFNRIIGMPIFYLQSRLS